MRSGRYAVRRVAPVAALRTGCLAGLTGALLPACLAACVVVLVAGRLHDALGGIQAIRLNILGQQLINLDLVDSLQLRGLVNGTAWFSDYPVLMFILVAGMALGLGGLIVAVAALLSSWIYNLFARRGAGLVVELVELDRVDAPAP